MRHLRRPLAAPAVLALCATVACGPAAPTGSPSVFPAEVGGLHVVTVSQALEARDRGLAGPHAVAGWFSQGPGHSCPVSLVPPSPLELGCHAGDWGLTESGEPVVDVRVDRDAGVVSIETRPRAVSGAWLQPVLETDRPIFPAGWTETWRPVPIVLIGHFDDPRAARCPPAEQLECRMRFVATEVAWPAGPSSGSP